MALITSQQVQPSQLPFAGIKLVTVAIFSKEQLWFSFVYPAFIQVVPTTQTQKYQPDRTYHTIQPTYRYTKPSS